MRTWLLIAVAVGVCMAGAAAAQAPPRVIPYSGIATDALAQPRSGVVGVLFAIYEEPAGGVPLWVELQAVTSDAQGRYAALLGSTTDGLPLDLFATGSARWLGVQLDGQNEQPRIMLTSVPYALKAADADTVGGLPASAFVTVESATADSTKTTTSASIGTRGDSTSSDGSISQETIAFG